MIQLVGEVGWFAHDSTSHCQLFGFELFLCGQGLLDRFDKHMQYRHHGLLDSTRMVVVPRANFFPWHFQLLPRLQAPHTKRGSTNNNSSQTEVASSSAKSEFSSTLLLLCDTFFNQKKKLILTLLHRVQLPCVSPSCGCLDRKSGSSH